MRGSGKVVTWQYWGVEPPSVPWEMWVGLYVQVARMQAVTSLLLSGLYLYYLFVFVIILVLNFLYVLC